MVTRFLVIKLIVQSFETNNKVLFQRWYLSKKLWKTNFVIQRTDHTQAVSCSNLSQQSNSPVHFNWEPTFCFTTKTMNLPHIFLIQKLNLPQENNTQKETKSPFLKKKKKENTTLKKFKRKGVNNISNKILHSNRIISCYTKNAAPNHHISITRTQLN